MPILLLTLDIKQETVDQGQAGHVESQSEYRVAHLLGASDWHFGKTT